MSSTQPLGQLSWALCRENTMWPFRKKAEARAKTSVAVAYLKAAATEDREPSIELSRDDTPVLKHLGNDLLVAYVADMGNAFSYVQYRDLEVNSVTEIQLHQIGLQNLASIASSGNLRVVPHRNIFAVLLDGNFEASMILLDNLWNGSFRQFVQGRYLIALPARDVLAFCDVASDAGRAELMEIIDRLKESEDHPLSHQLYVRHDSGWLREDAV